MQIKQFDVKTAFLDGDTEEIIHMQQPEDRTEKCANWDVASMG